MATSTVTSPTKFYPEGPNISNPSLESSDSSLAQLKRTIWACIRLGRLHTVMAYAIFPAPAIYAVVVWFAIHKEQFLAAGIDRATILRDFADLLFRLTVVIMSYRSAGLAWDDLIDRSFDGQVTRTKTRPLPAGNVSVDVACLYIAVQSFVTLVLTNALLPGHLMEATLFGGALIIPYPFMKRFTSFTQFGGALLIANGVLQGWAACASSSLAGRIGENHGSGWIGFGSMLWHNRGEISTLLMLEVLFEIAFEVVYGNQDTEEDIRLGLYSLSIFLGPTKSYFCVLACLVGFVWQFASILYRANLVLATPIVVLVGSLLSLETFRLDMTTPASCGGWAKRGVQIKILLCIALPASLVATFLQG